MMPREEMHEWGSHKVFAKSMSAHINVNPTTMEISFNGEFQTNKILFDSSGKVIATESGPVVRLNTLTNTDSVTLKDGTELTVAQVVETVTEFYKKAYDKQQLSEEEII